MIFATVSKVDDIFNSLENLRSVMRVARNTPGPEDGPFHNGKSPAPYSPTGLTSAMPQKLPHYQLLARKAFGKRRVDHARRGGTLMLVQGDARSANSLISFRTAASPRQRKRAADRHRESLSFLMGSSSRIVDLRRKGRGGV
jgi:hypothetical protein